MAKRVAFLSFLLILCIPLLGPTQGNAGTGTIYCEQVAAGSQRPMSAKLAGNMRGQSVGFVDVDGDGIEDQIVGAPYAASSGGTGAVLVYKGLGTGDFSPSASISLAGEDNLGFSFINPGDVDGDGKDDFAVGAINGNGPEASLSGSVTVYKGGTQGKFKGNNKVIAKLGGEGPMDKFGVSIAAGDLNGDGRKDLIVGAPFNTADPALYQGGAVYVLFAPEFTQKVGLRASSTNKGLGWALAAGDINGDAIDDLCISASGKILCYYGGPDFNPPIGTPDVTITSASTGFGKAVAIIGDLDGDGFAETLIGAPNATVNGNRDTGRLYVVKGAAGTRTVKVDESSADLLVRIDGAALFDRFGASIAPVGDISGDQKVDFAVGAPLADTTTSKMAGKVYFFRSEDIEGATTLTNSTVFEGFAKDQRYGASMAPAKNGRLLIGAPGAGANAGCVSIVDLLAGQAGSGGNGTNPPDIHPDMGDMGH